MYQHSVMEQTDLFSDNTNTVSRKPLPLALRMTPKELDDFVGQGHILGPGALLRRAVESDRLGSLILFGPPGTGKSALARIIVRKTCAHAEETNAVTIGVNDIRKIVEQAKLRLSASGKKTILVLDEIHHFNKTQQDALLPDVERGTVTLIGITTENPYFYVNAALLSRSLLFEFKQHDADALSRIIDRALADKEAGLGALAVHLHDDAREHLILQANGDARRLLNALEIGALTTAPGREGVIEYTRLVAEESSQKRSLSYDKSSDEHYDHVSAFIKSMRGSDPDAALFWMAKMLTAGEDPRFIARRIVICAAEDVGNADPHALLVAEAAFRAVEFVGMPEGKIPLAQAVTYIACAPKSNAAYLAIAKAEQEVVQAQKVRQVPNHLKDSHGDGQGKRGHGEGYLYPHDFPGHYVAQDYWPDPKVLYEPSDQGHEAKIKERLNYWRQQRKRTQDGAPHKKQPQ